MSEIMASLDDINAWLDSAAVDPDRAVVEATDANTDLIQISVARIIRGYLGRAYDTFLLASWDTPDETPELIRTVAGMLIASQLYMDKISGQEYSIDDRHYAQILYDRAMLLLNGILEGTLTILDPITGLPIIPVASTSLTELDFWPIDDTDRAFTMALRLD